MKLDKSMVDNVLKEIKELDARMTASAGTISQRKNEALEHIKTAELEQFGGSIPTDGVERTYLVSHNLTAAEVELEKAKARFDEAKQAMEDAVVAHLKARKSDVGAELGALRTQREELVNTAKAMGVLLKVDVDIPKAPKGGGSTGSSGPRAKSSSGSHYVKAEDGTISSYANDTFSGLAFYAFKRGTAPALKDALAAVGVTDLAKPWEAVITINGVTRTVGHRVDSDTVTS